MSEYGYECCQGVKRGLSCRGEETYDTHLAPRWSFPAAWLLLCSAAFSPFFSCIQMFCSSVSLSHPSHRLQLCCLKHWLYSIHIFSLFFLLSSNSDLFILASNYGKLTPDTHQMSVLWSLDWWWIIDQAVEKQFTSNLFILCTYFDLFFLRH